jgi:hypothetical protein
LERESADASDEMTHVLELFYKDFEVAVIKMFKGAILNTFRTELK